MNQRFVKKWFLPKSMQILDLKHGYVTVGCSKHPQTWANCVSPWPQGWGRGGHWNQIVRNLGRFCGNFEWPQVKDYLYSWGVHARIGSLGVGGDDQRDDNLTRVQLAV